MQLLETKDKAVENIEINLKKYPTGSKVTYELTVKRALLLSVWKLEACYRRKSVYYTVRRRENMKSHQH
jgi:hypothetical protein